MRSRAVWMALSVLAMMGATAAIASYATKHQIEKEQTAEAPAPKLRRASAPVAYQEPVPQPAPQQIAYGCDDGNIVGTIAGGAAGGLLGNQIGKGSGNVVATIGGTLGGAVLGNQFIPTRNVTCR